MSVTTNVMKGDRSGVQKLIKDRNLFMYDGCFCYLADLTLLLISTSYLLIYSIIFSIAARENSNQMIYGLICMHL